MRNEPKEKPNRTYVPNGKTEQNIVPEFILQKAEIKKATLL